MKTPEEKASIDVDDADAGQKTSTSTEEDAIKSNFNEPNEIFKRMVINDKKQNQRISSNLPKTFKGIGNATNLKSPSSASKKVNNTENRTNVRFIVCTLGLLALSVSQMSRMIMNQTIKDMVDKSMHKKDDVSTDGSCPWPEEEETFSESSLRVDDPHKYDDIIIDPILYYITSDKPPTLSTSSQVYYPTEDPLVEYVGASDDSDELQPDSDLSSQNEITVTSIPTPTPTPAANVVVFEASENSSVSSNIETIMHNDKFFWTMKQQSFLLGGFFYGYAVFMIPGGRLAEMYGAKYVVLLSVAGSGIINLATPWMARNSFELLMMSRVSMGIIQSGVFPAMYALFAKWLTPTETSLFAPLIKVNLRLGMFLGSFLPGILADWPSVYYFTGVVCAILSLLWLFISSSGPEGNDWVNKSELTHIQRKKRKPQPQEAIEMTTRTVDDEQQSKQVKVKIMKESKTKTPWLQIVTNPSVIGLILVKVTFNYAVDFFSILIPSYLAYVHHVPKGTVSAITTIMFSLQIALIVFIGWMAKAMIISRPFGLSKTAIRKIFQGIANWGMAFSLILLTFNDCNIIFVALLLQLMSLLSMFTAGGETMLPYDLSDQYPATIMAIANSIANFSGVTTTYLAGLILGDKSGSYDRWNILIYLIAGANIFGGLAFTLLVKAEPIDFERSSSNGEANQSNKKVSNHSEAMDGAPEVASVSAPEVEVKSAANFDVVVKKL